MYTASLRIRLGSTFPNTTDRLRVLHTNLTKKVSHQFLFIVDIPSYKSDSVFD